MWILIEYYILKKLIFTLSYSYVFQRQFSIIPLPTEVYFLDSLPMILYLNDIILVMLISYSFIFIASSISGKKLSQIDVKKALQWVK